ncbi:hypothetical protein FQP34_07055 [Peribacillus simplex]|uniref:DAC domain-containing protein n=1 Tax=Peribacillus simplex TaxID=1478 RepID=A0A8B5Y3N8_9BACI|nr:hypothetical protein [Peribacillus simplex]TVX83307.1 hypothetical protein FQP34_07055 [Peribacillus simplex]
MYRDKDGWWSVSHDPLELNGDLLRESQDFLDLLFKKIGISEKPMAAIVYLRERLFVNSSTNEMESKLFIFSTKVICQKDGEVCQQIDETIIPTSTDRKVRKKFTEELAKNYIDELTFLSKANHYLFSIDYQYKEVIGGTKTSPFGLSDGLVTIFGVGKDIKKEFKKEKINYTFLIEILRLFTKNMYIDKYTSELIDDLLEKAGKTALNDKIYNGFMNDMDKKEGINLFELMHNISLIKYESNENRGNILFCSRDAKLENKLILSKPIPLIEYSSAIAIRKLLEISGGDVSLLCDGEYIFGIGQKNVGQDLPKKSFKIIFNGQGKWDVVTSKNQKVMSVAYKVPSLPKTPVEEPEFAKKFKETFDSLEYKNVWGFIELAKKQPHGTMVVVTKEAEKEADRLSNQSFLIKKTNEFEDGIVNGITSIDGAVLLDHTGVCYAIGVILDGIANKKIGTISRGARYNSALRYLNYCSEEKIPCLIVIVSEDKYINIKTIHDYHE